MGRHVVRGYALHLFAAPILIGGPNETSQAHRFVIRSDAAYSPRFGWIRHLVGTGDERPELCLLLQSRRPWIAGHDPLFERYRDRNRDCSRELKKEGLHVHVR